MTRMHLTNQVLQLYLSIQFNSVDQAAKVYVNILGEDFAENMMEGLNLKL